jgi:DnaJ-class molecular chaperone
MSNLYSILGVDRSADADALRTAYRQLARENHPDLRPDDSEAEERFKRASQAYAVLSDAEKRALYDEFGDVSLQAGFDAEKARQAQDVFAASAAPGDGFSASFTFEDLLGGLFGREGGLRRVPRPGPDLRADVSLDFVDAARGGEHGIQIARPTASGELKQERLTVRIPPGVRDGGRIRLAGKGGESPDGPPGDLWLDVRVRPHPVFRREGRDLQLELPVSVREAALGAQVPVPTLEGRATVSVPAGSQGGARLRLRGKGVPASGSRPPGDLIATLRIRIPRELDDAARAALDTLASCETEDPREALFSES